jgi:hypothetical protein
MRSVVGLKDCSDVQFKQSEVSDWFGPILARLIGCHDREVRLAVSELIGLKVIPLAVKGGGKGIGLGKL